MTPAALTELVAEILARHGLALTSARIVAEVVVAAERDGTRSHGLLRLPGYVSTLKSGWIDRDAQPVVHDAGPGLVATDAANGFAQVALAASRAPLVAKARTQGVAALTIRRSHHFAALWPDVEPFAVDGLIALAVVNVRSRIAAWGGKTKLLGTNPMAFACPRAAEPPIVWDHAASVMAQGEVLLAASEGRDLPAGVGLDAEGTPTLSPAAILAGGALLPFADHKGASIAFMVEVLAAALTGGRFGFEDDTANYPGAQTSNAGEFVLVIDPRRGVGKDFFTRVEQLVERLRASGVARLPGDRRYAARRRALARGIAVSEADRAMLDQLLAEAPR